MTDMKVCAPLIGDVVRSRDIADRGALHAHLVGVLAQINSSLSPVTELRITVGDEYQGAFVTLGEAIEAALLIRLAMLPRADVRHGIGWGPTATLQQQPRVEDGAGWWAARDAIVASEQTSQRPGLRRTRDQYCAAESTAGPSADAVNAALVCRDQLIDPEDTRSIRVLGALLRGQTQQQVAEAEGISASAISQRVRSAGLAAVLAAHAMLRALA